MDVSTDVPREDRIRWESERWTIVMRVDRVISGHHSGQTIRFRVHSPALTGLTEVGKTYEVAVDSAGNVVVAREVGFF